MIPLPTNTLDATFTFPEYPSVVLYKFNTLTEVTDWTPSTLSNSVYILDKTTQIKLSEVVTLLKPLDKTQSVKDENIISLLQYYQLIDEIKSVK